ncbi:MAG: DUF2612 domain-containing protein, partial [Pseudomonadota bacterium]|nr:DUF2612 domain-containing protein [Pseudomonadota bacterium]
MASSLPASYYLALPTSEYRQSANFLAWLAVPIGRLADASACLDSFPAGLDLATAVGAQLDLLGQLVGQARTVGFQPTNGVSPVLDDATYRLLLMARVAQNEWNGTIDGLQGVWQTLFPGGRIVIVDAQNMSATIVLSGAFSSIIQDLVSNGYIVP